MIQKPESQEQNFPGSWLRVWNHVSPGLGATPLVDSLLLPNPPVVHLTTMPHKNPESAVRTSPLHRSRPGRLCYYLRGGVVAAALALFPGFGADAAPWATKELRAGVIGTDTSHVPAFAELFRTHPEWKIKVVAAYKGGSPDLPPSADRLERFATTMREKHNVELVESIEELLKKVDVVLLQSLDGRVHLDQVRPVLKAGKRV